MHKFLEFALGIKFYMFRTVPLSIIRSFSLYTQQWYMLYWFADSLRAGSHIPLLCLQWRIPDDGQRNSSKHVYFYSKNKLEKLVISSRGQPTRGCSPAWWLDEVLTTPPCKIFVKKHSHARCLLWRQNIPEVNYSPTRISGGRGGECF